MSDPVNVACIKWGNKYSAAYVSRLYQGVSRFLKRPFRFLCFTDRAEGIDAGVEIHPLPVEPFEADLQWLMSVPKRKGAWRKVSLFKPGLANMKGPVLGLDIDVCITGPLDDLFDFAPGQVCMRRDWLERLRFRPGGNGSVFRYDPSRHPWLYERFAADPRGVAAASNGSEQKYTSLTAISNGALTYFPPSWIASFKRNAIPWPPLNFWMEPHLPGDTRVMCFHGTPKMEEALDGYRGEWKYTTRPARWLRTHWLGETR